MMMSAVSAAWRIAVDRSAADPTLVISTPHHHNSELELGGTYFFLLANAHNAVADGSLVTLVIGDARTEHVRVQG